MKPLDSHQHDLKQAGITADESARKPLLSMPWWVWVAPSLMLPLFSILSRHGFILEIFFVALQCATLPALLMAGICWLVRKREDFVHRAGLSLLVALIYGLLVSFNVYFLFGPDMSGLLVQANSVDHFIFCVLLVVFSSNLGLSSILALSLIVNKLSRT